MSFFDQMGLIRKKCLKFFHHGHGRLAHGEDQLVELISIFKHLTIEYLLL